MVLFPPFPRKPPMSLNSDSSSQLKFGLGLTFCVYCTPEKDFNNDVGSTIGQSKEEQIK